MFHSPCRGDQTLFKHRDEIESPHGRTIIAIALFQDMAVVPMLLLIET